MAGQRTIGRKLGHIYDKAAALEDDPELPRRACIGSDSRPEAAAVVIGGLAHVGAIGTSGGSIAAAPASPGPGSRASKSPELDGHVDRASGA